jgi:predicted nucleic-acid-binding protein
MPPWLDTNIIIRFVTNDNPDQSTRAAAFLQRVETGQEVVALAEGTLVECVQVLSSSQLYNLPRADIAETLSDLISMRGLRLTPKRTYLRALDLYAATRVDFVDALLVAKAEGMQPAEIISFDRDFDRFPSVRRREP